VSYELRKRYTPPRSAGRVRRPGHPGPRPQRTVHATFTAYGSSIGQRAFGKHAVSPIGLGVHLSVPTPVPATERIRWRRPHQLRSLRPRHQICDTPYAGWLTLHARRHQREVCPLSGGVMLQPLSSPLQVGIRLLPPPLPAAPSVGLAACLPPQGRATGLPRSADVTERVRSCLWAGGAPSAAGERCSPSTWPRTFWSRPVSTLGLFSVTTPGAVHLG
jgi:hypothetical protein